MEYKKANGEVMSVVPQKEVEQTLAGLYQEMGDIGRDRFYALLKRNFLGISRRAIHTPFTPSCNARRHTNSRNLYDESG